MSATPLPLNIGVATVRPMAYTLLSQDSGWNLASDSPERGRQLRGIYNDISSGDFWDRDPA